MKTFFTTTATRTEAKIQVPRQPVIIHRGVWKITMSRVLMAKPEIHQKTTMAATQIMDAMASRLIWVSFELFVFLVFLSMAGMIL